MSLRANCERSEADHTKFVLRNAIRDGRVMLVKVLCGFGGVAQHKFREVASNFRWGENFRNDPYFVDFVYKTSPLPLQRGNFIIWKKLNRNPKLHGAIATEA